VQLQELPLTSGGKVDRQALPEPEVKASVEYVEPRDEIEKCIREIWQEVLDLERIGVFDNFFEIGGHSLNATVMIAKLRREFNFSLPLTEIFSSPTISQVAKYIRSAAAEPGVERIAEENLVLLKKGYLPDSHLFLIHGGIGSVEIFTEFCNLLSPHWNCWGYQADRLENYMPKTITIEAVGQKYLEKMKKVQPHGPYHIAGWCIGGTIAFEIVRRLEQLEEGIGFLGIISAPPPAPEKARITAPSFTLESELQDILRDFRNEQLAESLKEVTELRDLWQKVVDFFENYEYSPEQFRSSIPGDIAAAIPNVEQVDVKGLIYNLNMNKTFARARNSYLPGKKIKTGVYFFDAAEQEIRNRQQWNNYSCKPMQFYEVPGDHFSMFEMPHAPAFAKLFDSFLP
jgi:thioesterase domain-containing protein/acyl carrier protein